MPSSNPMTAIPKIVKIFKAACVNYFIRYAGRPAMVKIESQNTIKNQILSIWFYNDHKDEKRYDVTDNVIDFINRLIIHIPDYHFLIIRCQCF